MDLPKLVRDRVPESIRERGAQPKTRSAGKGELQSWLFRKLHEELSELEVSPNIEEFADLLEVVRALAEILKVNLAQVEEYRNWKFQRLGGFVQGIILEGIEEESSSQAARS